MSKRTDSAEHLKAKWNVEVEDAYYHVEGLFYNPLFNFPGAYFDENGYVIFKTEEEYKNCQYLKMSYGKYLKVNVHKGISKIPWYVRKN